MKSFHESGKLTEHMPFSLCAELISQYSDDGCKNCVTDLAEHHHRSRFRAGHLHDALHKQQRVAEPHTSAQVIVDVT